MAVERPHDVGDDTPFAAVLDPDNSEVFSPDLKAATCEFRIECAASNPTNLIGASRPVAPRATVAYRMTHPTAT